MAERAPASAATPWPVELFLLHAPERAGLRAALTTLQRHRERAPDVPLASLACALGSLWHPEGACLAVVATDGSDLDKKLEFAARKLDSPSVSSINDRSGIFYFDEPLGATGEVAWVVPGEGSQYPGMLGELALYFPEVQDAFGLVDAAVAAVDDAFVPSRLVFPRPGAPPSRLWDMAVAVEAVSAANLACARVLDRLGFRAQRAVGHSSGEFTALEIAGALSFATDEERLAFVADGFRNIGRISARTDLPETRLLTVGGPDRGVIDGVVAARHADVVVAMDNCPHQVVLCARAASADAIAEALVGEGALVTPLEFGRPYHTSWFTPALRGLDELFAGLALRAPRIPIYSCLTARPFPDDPAAIRDLGTRQWASPVRFRETVERMHDDGTRVFVEAGPRGNLCAFIDDILKDRPHAAVPIDRFQRKGIHQLEWAAGLLSAHGVPWNPASLYSCRGVEPADLTATTAARRTALSRAMPRIAPDAVSVPALAPGAPTEHEAAGATRSPAPPPPALSATDAAIQAHLGTMERFLRIQHELVQTFLIGGAPQPVVTPAPVPAPASAPRSPFALLGDAEVTIQEAELIARAVFDIDEEVFLRCHTLGTGRISDADPQLTGYPVMPLTFSLEILAEAASLLCPGPAVVGLRNVRAHRWLGFERSRTSVRVHARVQAGGPRPEVHVELREADDDREPRAAFRPCIAEALVLLAPTHAEPPAAAGLELEGERPCDWSGEAIYPTRLFHGPRFRGVRSVTRWGTNGCLGTVEVLPRDRLFRDDASPRFAFDPVLLDSVGATLGLWAAYHAYDGTVFLPFRIEAVDFHGPPPAPGTSFGFRLRIRERTGLSTSADIVALDERGRAVLAVRGWEDREFSITPALHRVVHEPRRQFFCDTRPIDAGLPAGSVVTVSPVLPDGYFTDSHGVWEKVLAFAVLSDDEREEWRSKTANDRRRADWLLGRCAVKEAVRHHLRRTAGLEVASADVHVVTDSKGRPSVSGPWAARVGRAPAVSLSHTAGRALAIACDAARGRVGIDWEALGPVAAEVEEGAFDPEERALLASRTTDHDEWVLRGWTAKEALAKALGSGLGDDPTGLRIVDAEFASGRVRMRLADRSREEFPALTGVDLWAHTSIHEGAVLATLTLSDAQ